MPKGKSAKQECLDAYNAFEREYDIKKNVPDAIWDFVYTRPAPPKNYREIANYGKPKEERKFPYYSQEFIDRMESLADKENTPQEYDDFFYQEWDRRLNGFFFYNGDKLEYITGHHYATLQYWKIPATKEVRGVYRKGRFQPDFVDAQRDAFYAIDYARKDKKSAGVCWVSFRRAGKTSIALADGYWDTTENEESVFAIQSKTEKDAKKQFKKLIDSWKTVPLWFKPIDTEETSQSNRLYFGEKKRSGVSREERVYKNALNSIIYPENSKEEALDGEYVSYVFQDELGKSSRALDVEERWNITREALFDGNRIIGFGFLTSTVEDQDKYGAAYFKNIFKNSDPNNRLPNGLTHSYLYRLFIPAYYGYRGEDDSTGNVVSFVDEWGYTNVEASRKYQQRQYKARTGDALLSYRRKYPITIEDCWVTNDSKNNFSISRLLEQKIWNEQTSYQDVVRGNFAWRNGDRWGKVDFYPDENGRWLVSWMPNEVDRNRYEFYNGTQRRPTRSFCFTGIDPFSHGKVVDEEQGSNGAAVTVLKNYPSNSMKEAVVCVYNYRQSDPNAQIEDMIMQCVFYSSPALIESNVSVAINGFQDKGFYGYCEYNPLETDLRKLNRGLKGYATTSKENVENLISYVASYILDNVGKQEDGTYGHVPFNELIQQCIDFNPEKRGPYDLVMAFGLAVIMMRAEKKSAKVEWDFSDWMPKANEATYNRIKAGLTGVDNPLQLKPQEH